MRNWSFCAFLLTLISIFVSSLLLFSAYMEMEYLGIIVYFIIGIVVVVLLAYVTKERYSLPIIVFYAFIFPTILTLLILKFLEEKFK